MPLRGGQACEDAVRAFFAGGRGGGAAPETWEERALDMEVMGEMGLPPLLPKPRANVTVFPGESDKTPHQPQHGIGMKSKG